MKNVLKKIKILCFILLTFFLSVINVNANGGTTGGDSNIIHGDCKGGCDWSYSTRGIRLSLYKYDGTKLTYYGSKDYCSKDSGENLDCTIYGSYMTNGFIGKIAYQHINTYAQEKNAIFNIKKTTFKLAETPTFPSYFRSYSEVEDVMKGMFGLNSGNADTILEKIKSVFGEMASSVSKEEFGKLYLTIEPTLEIHKKEAYTSPGGYYGSIYELTYYFGIKNNGFDLGDSNYPVYKDGLTSIRAKSTFGSKDENNFLGNLMTLATSTLSAPDVSSKNRSSNSEKATSNEGYAINALWFGSYAPVVSCSITESSDKKTYTLNVYNGDSGKIFYDIKGNENALKYNVRNNTYSASFKDTRIFGAVYNNQGNKVATCNMERTIPTCKQTCSGKNGDDLLGCAENYCQAYADNSSEKKSCITTCGYTEPKFNNCASSTSVSGKETYCDAPAKGNLGSCTPANTSTYYQTNCNEESTIDYGNSLPKTLQPGTGFGYTPVLSGSKTCTMTFEVNKWKFDYAASYTTAERNSLKEKLKNFQNVSSNSVWSKDLDNKYKYDSSDADISIEVTNSNDVKSSNRKTTKKLIPSQTINLLNSDVVVTSGGSAIIPLFAGGSKSSETIYGIIKTNSSNKTSYKLPAICMKTGSGELYEPSNGKCNSINDGPYYEYYTDLKIKKDKYDTKTTVKKSTSSLNVQNTCNYSVESPVSCSIVKGDNQYELIIHNKNGVAVTYGLSNTAYVINNLKTYSPITRNIKLYGAVAIDNSIVATCKYSDVVTSDDTCTAKFKAADYSSIKEYCDSNWLSDTANYASADDCFNSCSSGNNSCKNNPNFSSSDRKAVENYCKLESNYLKDGYKNTASCINDCLSTVKVPDCLGIACDYIYRPISLVDPFPNNRTPGYNWIGKEIYITDDLQNPVLNSSAPAEYVIELTPERINEIKKNTKEYNSQKNKNAYIDYVPVNEYNLDGKYESKFIHSSDITQGGFSLYFTKIATVSQK